MANVRLIGRLDVKGPNLIKSINLEGLRVVGDPQEHAIKYYEQGIDELIYIDLVASLYRRNKLPEIVEKAATAVYVPMTVGGGIRSTDDVQDLLLAGADKVAVNSSAICNPNLIEDIAERFGSQCMVLSIEAQKKNDGWEAYYNNGREPSGLSVVDWAREGEKRGAGEILLTSIDQEGTAKGFDYALVEEVCQAVSIPVIASGGMGSPDDGVKVVKESKADAVAMAHVLHYNINTVSEVRTAFAQNNIPVRHI